MPSGNQKPIHRAERIGPDLQAGKAQHALLRSGRVLFACRYFKTRTRAIL
jgi:hypothetical protein